MAAAARTVLTVCKLMVAAQFDAFFAGFRRPQKVVRKEIICGPITPGLMRPGLSAFWIIGRTGNVPAAFLVPKK